MIVYSDDPILINFQNNVIIIIISDLVMQVVVPVGKTHFNQFLFLFICHNKSLFAGSSYIIRCTGSLYEKKIPFRILPFPSQATQFLEVSNILYISLIGFASPGYTVDLFLLCK